MASSHLVSGYKIVSIKPAQAGFFTPADADTLRDGKVQERLQDKHAGNAAGNDQRSTSNEQRSMVPIHFSDYAPLSALSTMRALCLKNAPLVPLCGQVKTVLGKTRPKRPYGTKRPDLLRAQPMFEKSGTIAPKAKGSNMPKRGNQGTRQKSLKHRQQQA